MPSPLPGGFVPSPLPGGFVPSSSLSPGIELPSSVGSSDVEISSSEIAAINLELSLLSFVLSSLEPSRVEASVTSSSPSLDFLSPSSLFVLSFALLKLEVSVTSSPLSPLSSSPPSSSSPYRFAPHLIISFTLSPPSSSIPVIICSINQLDIVG